MEEDNNPSGSGGQQNNLNNPPYRVRRPSTSIISSTTPMFQPPQNPTPTNRQRLGQHNNNMNHNFGPGDIDDDVQPQSSSSSSSSSSLRGRLSAALNSVVGNNSSSSNNNNRPQSPLGSPDSTAYWAPSPHHHSNASTSYRSPLTPGGMCVVSSSTSDDIPQSPFSPEELSNHGFPQPPAPPSVLPSRATDNNREDFNTGNRNQVPRRRPLVASSSSTSSSSSLNLSLSASLLSNNSNRSFLGGNNHSNSISQQLQQSENQDLNQNRTSTGPSSSSSSAHQSFNISPLRNKIKKASSFERFSLAQAAIISNSSGNNANSAASSQNAANNESSISSLPPNLNNSSMGTATNSNSIQRAIWEPSPSPVTTDNNNPPSTSSSSSAMGSLRSSFTTHGHTEKFHIKIPSKKLAAKIASVYEQEKLNEQFNAQLAAAEAISVVGSKRPSSSLSSGGLTSSVIASISQNDGLLSSQTQNNNNNNNPSTLAQILNQSSNIHMIPDESINTINQQDVVNHENLIRELSEAPLNLTDNSGTTNSSITNTSSSSTTTSHHTQHSSLRNPVISSRGNLTKKILTPKQKLLHRLQSGELMSSLSPPPQPTVTLSQHIQQQSLPIQQQQSVNSSPVVTIHQSIITTESIQNNGINHVISISNSPQHSPPQQQQQQQQLDQYSYDSLLRSRDDFVVQDSLMGKVVGEDPNNAVSNMLSAYDPADAYSYYSYQNILGDEIFTGNNSANNSSRHLLMMPGNLATMDQPQGPLEFVLGFSNTVDDHDGGERGRDDDLQLNNIDPNDDALSAIKSQNPTDSTLRNLLMMEPMRNNQNDDNAWLALAAAEYQNRINPESAISISRGGGGGSIMRGSSSSSGLGNIVGGSSSVVSNNQGAGGISNSWVNEWPRSSWQSHNSIGVQDEVMDMSMMDHVKGPMSNQMKRLQMQMQGANNDHASSIDEIDLTTGLPILSQMSVNMPIDLQQPMSIMSHGGGNSKDTLPIDLQQHHRMDIDDEPVNLMAVNMEQDQELVHHHHHHNSHSSSSSSSSSHLNQSHSHLEQSSSKMMHHQQNNSNYHSPSSQDLQQSVSDLNLNNANSNSPPSDLIDERRIIRVKKPTKDTLIASNLNDIYQLSADDQEHANIIMDKPIEPKSIASLPSPFRFSRVENNEIAVFNNNRSIPPNCRLGPLEGPIKKAIGDVSNMNASYPSLVMVDGDNILWQLDRSDDELCNWMKFVRLAHSIKDQNAQVVESDGYLYFMTCKEITPHTELQVGYSYEYAQKYALPIFLPTDAFVDHEEENDRITNQNDNNLAKTNNSSNNNSPNNNSQHQMIQDEEDIDDEQLEDRDEEQEESRNLTIETYPCFECDQEFSLVEELQAHLNTHKDTEPIRKPKKKAIRKFQTPEINNIERNMPAINNNNSNNNNQQIEKELSQQMNADSSTIVVEVGGQQSMQSSSSGNCSIQRSTADIGKQQDNSVTTGVGQPAAPPKVKCTMCYKSFLNKERLEKHMIVHSDEDTKPLKCNFCPKRFLTNSALAGHIKTHSEEGKFFECPMCNFSTPQLLLLKEHVQTHKNRETGFFYCPKCPKKFTAYSMIRKHIRAFHGPRQFTCEHEDCPMSFPTSDKLKLHQLKHSDHREFLCSECGKQFKRKDKLREHTKRIHETKKKSIEINIPKDKNSKKFIPKVAPEEYEKFPFKCQDCMVGFKRRGMLVNHLAKRHPEKKIKSIPELNQPILRLTRNYPCLYCERIYKSSSKRKAHILKGHPGRPVPPQLRGNGSNNNNNNNNNAIIIEAAVASSVVVNEVVARPPTAGTIVQTVTEDGDPRSGIMNVSCTNNTAENNLVSTTSTSQSLRKEASIVGKVAALPHACQFCYREYATRAKLLQHQRKAHINLMPAEMQTPRTQKNNVQSKKDKALNSEATSNKSVIKLEGIANMIQQKDPTLIIPDSTSASTSTIQTVTSVSAEGLNEGSVIGYLLTTSSGDLGNLIPSELVMFGGPLPNLGNGEQASILSSQPQTMNVNPSQNITILASTSNNPNSKNSSM